MTQFFIGIDQGSSTTKGLILSSDGEEQYLASVPVDLKVLSEDRVEQDPDRILESVKEVVTKCQEFAKACSLPISGIGLSTQRSGVCAWSRVGEVVHPLLSWRDTRTKSQIGLLSQEKLDRIRAKTSLIAESGHYAGGKIRLLQRATDRHTFVGTLDSFLLFRLTNEQLFVTDHSMASRTLLYDIQLGEWDQELCDILDVDRRRLAGLRHSASRLGTYRELPIFSAVGDQQAALIGTMSSETEAALNIGTIASYLVPIDAVQLERGFVTNILYTTDAVCHYLIEGLVNACGPVLRYLIEERKVCGDFWSLNELCEQGRDGPGAAFLPIGGTGTPDFRSELANSIVDSDGSDADLARAAVESIGCFIAETINLLRAKQGIAPAKILVTGGASQIPYLLQFVADCTGIELLHARETEASARGAALLAMVGAGVVKNPAQINSRRGSTSFTPQNPKRAKARLEKWQALPRVTRK